MPVPVFNLEKSMKKIIIFTHNPIRDPITDDCLVSELTKRGHMVWKRGFLEDDRNMILCIRPDMIILPEIRCGYTLDLAKLCKSWGIQIVVRPCEVGISEESVPLITEDYKRAIFGNWPTNDIIDLMLCWGPRMQSQFCEHSKIDKEKTVSIGGIAFDQFFLPRPPQNVQRTEKRRVLFATGFAYADRNPQYSMPEALPDDPIHRNMALTDSRARARWFEHIKKFVELAPDWEVWIKLHSGEKQEVYQAVLRDVPVTYCPNIPAVMALQHVDAVVHCGSTMAYEAHLMGKPAFNLNNICQDVIVSKISPSVETVEELVKGLADVCPDVSAPLWLNANPEIIDILEKEYYGTVDGKASERAAEAICKLPETKTTIPAKWPETTEWKYATSSILKNVEVWACRACGVKYHVQGPREMVLCPKCGIANVKIAVPQK